MVFTPDVFVEDSHTFPQQSPCSATWDPFFQPFSETTFWQNPKHPSPFSLPGPVRILSPHGHSICYSISLPTSYTHRSISVFQLVLPFVHPQIALFWFWGVFFPQLRKKSPAWFTIILWLNPTVFTDSIQILSSQYRIYHSVYAMYKLHVHHCMYYFLTKLYVFASQLWKTAFHPIAVVPALKVIHFFLDDSPNFLYLDNASQHHGISKF